MCLLYSRTLFVHSVYRRLHLLTPASHSTPPSLYPLSNHKSDLYVVILFPFHRCVLLCVSLDSSYE